MRISDWSSDVCSSDLIVNISSGLTRIIMANRAAYATMKAAVETMTKYMAFELGERRIAVNCVAPGAIATDFSGGVVRDNPDVAKAIAGMTALGRPGQPDDIGPMIDRKSTRLNSSH